VRRADLVGAVILFVFGAWFALTAAVRYPYWGANGPGSGFFPVWLGSAMAVLAVVLFIHARRSREPATAWLPRGHGGRRLLGVLALTAIFIALLKIVGMIAGTALFLVALLRFIEGHTWRVSVAVAVAVAVVNWLVFTYWLQVPFPVGVFGI
jgi:putative tricarboxylic transport membrane protein